MSKINLLEELRIIERQIGILISQTEPNTIEREVLVDLLNRVTETIGIYIVKSSTRS